MYMSWAKKRNVCGRPVRSIVFLVLSNPPGPALLVLLAPASAAPVGSPTVLAPVPTWPACFVPPPPPRVFSRALPLLLLALLSINGREAAAAAFPVLHTYKSTVRISSRKIEGEMTEL